ncbi:zeatin O-glucosyltransferase-like [Punica granatum]|uniref:Glycosyltransferase n=2 Tax=Punica granatum TaxID=22663 RepID=A0A218W328_PUNGR|nr:zeatin O-glucosyltransferase-like [Punica granatum]OWM67264.1 hypothetical protein CDL15_Pgr000716 [Punica granatum]PKI31627.1 hypothetical protein CRG98_048009 [Punica granatum]
MAPASDHPHPVYGWKEPCTPPVGASEVVVVMVPLPAQGHLNQLLHLSRLISSYGIPVHYVAAATHIHQAKFRVHGWDLSSATAKRLLHVHGFDIPPFPSPPPDPTSKSKFPSQLIPSIEAASFHLRHHVADLVRSLASGSMRRVVVIHDSLMASAVQDAFSVSNAETFVFHSVSAFSVYWYLARAAAGQLPLGENDCIFLEDPPPLEGCFPAEFLKFIEHQYKFVHLGSGRLYNTSRAIEKVFMELLEKEEVNQTHWAVGPFNPVRIPSSSSLASEKARPEGGKHKCIEWLDRQSSNSVIYISFGTTIALSKEQIREIATGLESSGQRFIWVLRDADKGDMFNNANDDDDSYETRKLAELSLPKGFEERVEGVGLVVREWAPQLEILGHPSVGGFMSHCGWNSCMESITVGVPIAAWPMHSDQLSNSVLVTRILRIGVMVKEWPALVNSALVDSSSIQRAVKLLMSSQEGDCVRKRAAELGEAVQRSVRDGGVSRAELDLFIAHITRCS